MAEFFTNTYTLWTIIAALTLAAFCLNQLRKSSDKLSAETQGELVKAGTRIAQLESDQGEQLRSAKEQVFNLQQEYDSILAERDRLLTEANKPKKAQAKKSRSRRNYKTEIAQYLLSHPNATKSEVKRELGIGSRNTVSNNWPSEPTVELDTNIITPPIAIPAMAA